MKIAYSVVIKNPKRKTAPFYGRIRQDGRERFIPLNTDSRAEAMKWVDKQKNLLFRVNEYLDEGNPAPQELLAQLATVDAVPFPHKVASDPASAPGGALERWEVDMRSRGMRGTTVDNYMKAVRLMLGDTPVERLDREKVSAMITGRVKLSDNTRRHYANSMRSFLNFIGRPDLASVLPHIRYEESDHVFWTEEQMFDIVTEVNSDTPARTEQYRLYFSVLAETGARNSEARLIKWKHVSDGCIRFPAEATKGRKSRTVPISTSLWAELEVIRKDPETDVFDLVSPNQTRRYKVLKRALNKLGLEGSLHTFRRSRSALLYRKTGNIKICAQLLGHSPQVALKIYQDEVGVEELRKAVFDE